MSANKLKVTKNEPQNVGAFVGDLNNSISEVGTPLLKLFNVFRTNEISGEPRKHALSLFDEWSYRSQLPTFSEVFDFTKGVFERAVSIGEVHSELVNKLPFDRKVVEELVD
ncbi:MAG: hypothetical protein QXT84_06420, partial [Candidatus Bathyarchaeia archaeon]